MERSYLFDFDPGGLVEVCRDPRGVRVELFEMTGIRERDADELLGSLREELAARFRARPLYRRIVVWSDAGRLRAEDDREYGAVRQWLDEGLRELQHPWQMPMVGQVGCAVLEGPLPGELQDLRVGDPWDFDHDRERAPERRARRRR